MDALGAPELRANTPLEIIDGAFAVVRRGGFSAALRAWSAGALLALAVLAVYYLEQVEGIRSGRPLLALVLVVAWWWRAIILSAVARDAALQIRPSLPMAEAIGRPLDVVCTASVVGMGLWVWLWPVAGLAILSPFAVVGLLPFLAIRGSVAPSWLARAGCSSERGLRAFGDALDDTSGVRGVMLVVELLLLLGCVALFGNVYALMSFGLLLGHSMLGVDVAFVTSFLSPDNELVLLLVAALTLTLFEPLRAAVSAHAFVDARSRRDGADLHAAVDAVIELSDRSAQRKAHRAGMGKAVAGFLFALSLCSASPAAAQSRGAIEADDNTRREVGIILAKAEFSEFAQRDGRTIRDLFKRFFAWLESLDTGETDRSDSFNLQLPIPPPAVMLILGVIALIIIALYVSSQRKALQATPGSTSAEGSADPLDRAPAAFLDDAARLAQQGRPREALRALYVATLVALDRRHLITFESSRTNWQYIRGMPRGETRTLFSTFTRVFDHKWYGRETTSMEDYLECRRLADRICADEVT